MASEMEHRLAAVLAADMAGYSRLMGSTRWDTHAVADPPERTDQPRHRQERGRIIKTTGDGMLVEFQSVADAVRCAIEVQERMARRNADVPEDRQIQFSIGINLRRHNLSRKTTYTATA